MDKKEFVKIILDTFKKETENQESDAAVEPNKDAENQVDQNGSATDPLANLTADDVKAMVKEAIAESVKEQVVQNSPAVGAPSNGGDVLTIEQIQAMDGKEVNDRWEEVSKVLESQPKNN